MPNKVLTPAELVNVLLQEMKLQRLRDIRYMELGAAARLSMSYSETLRLERTRAELAAIEYLETCAGATIADLLNRMNYDAQNGPAVRS